MSSTPEAPEHPVREFPEPPVFTTAEEERLHRKQRLAAGLRLFSRFGFDEGIAGHITARDPEHCDHFWVNPLGMHFGHVRVSDLILVNHQGEVVEGAGPVNAAAFVIHSQVHAARPDVMAAAHAHSTYGKCWSALGRPLAPSPKMPVPSTTTTPSSTTTPGWCSTSRRKAHRPRPG